MQFLVLLARLCAIGAGVLLTVITLMTCTSIVGREFLGAAITGDFELSGAATGAAIGLFMPWCQAKRGNIIVDFFTAKCSDSANERMDRMGALFVCVGSYYRGHIIAVSGIDKNLCLTIADLVLVTTKEVVTSSS